MHFKFRGLLPLAGYVDAGGRAVAFADETDFIDDVFFFSINEAGDSADSLLQGSAAGTRFASGPAGLPDNNGDTAQDQSTFPVGGRSLYADPDGGSEVSLFPFGAGDVTFLGWDWYDSAHAPDCDSCQDGGWNDVLNRAISGTVPPPPVVPRDVTAPVLSKLSVTKKSLQLTSSEAAAVTVSISKRVTKKKHGKKRKVYVLKKTVTKTVPAGKSTIKFSKLKKGKYKFTATATDAAGNKSKAVSKTKSIH